MPVYNYMDLSTAHLIKKDAQLLGKRPEGGPIIRDYAYGWWVWVPSDDMTEMLRQYRKVGFSPNFSTVLRYARNLHCNWINFDQDADLDDDLPKFRW